MDAVTQDLNKYMQKQDFFAEKVEEFLQGIEPQLQAIENIAKQIKPKLAEYKECFELDFKEIVKNEIIERVNLTL